MSHKDDKKFQDSTTDFFLKIMQKEKTESQKEHVSPMDNINTTTTKTFNSMGKFFNYINKLLDKLLSSRSSVMVLSLVMAAILFVSIAGGDVLTTPTSGATLDNVPITIEGLDDSLELSGIPSSVSVVLLGPSLDIYPIRLMNNYSLYLDVSGLTSGEHTVSFKTKGFPDSLEVFIVPDSFKIKLSPKVDAKFELGYQFINENELDSKYSVSVDKIDLNSVTVTASQDTLKKINKVVACIDVSDKTEAFEQEAVIKALDAEGEELEVTIAPTTVHVECSVASYSKVVPINVTFTGDLAQGYQITAYTPSQPSVTIYGTEENLSTIDSVYVEVDLSLIKNSTTVSGVSIRKENGINKFSTSTVDVFITVEKVITKSIDNVPIQVLNQAGDYKVSFVGSGQYATVSVSGTETKVSSITASNIQAVIDIEGMKVGTHKAKVSVAIDDETLAIELLSSSNITINIERK